jgi:hypothetical protein
MNLKDSNNPAVLDAIRNVVKQSQEKVVAEQQKQAQVETSKYSNFKPISEALKGNQHKIDANNNNKVDAHDFHLLRKGKKKEEKVEEATDTPGNSYAHQCAIHVKHSKLGEGRTLFSQHAEPDAEGNIAWYDVMFAEGIEKKVPTAELEILVSESHGNHKKK